MMKKLALSTKYFQKKNNRGQTEDKPWKVRCLAWKVHCLAWKVRCLAWNLHLPKIAFFLSFFYLCEYLRNKISKHEHLTVLAWPFPAQRWKEIHHIIRIYYIYNIYISDTHRRSIYIYANFCEIKFQYCIYIYIYNRFKYIANTLIHSLPSQRWPKLAPMAEKFLKAAQARQEKAAGQIAASDSQLTIGYGSEGETRRSATPKYRTDWG